MFLLMSSCFYQHGHATTVIQGDTSGVHIRPL